MPRKNRNAIILLKNTFAKEYISIVLLKHNFKFIATPQNISQALTILEQQKSNLFICEDDFETIEIIQSKYLKMNTSLKTILLVSRIRAEEILEYYKLGILGVLNISSPHFELGEAINAVLNNDTYISTFYRKVIKKGDIEKNNVLTLLTVREKEIMSLIARGYTNAQLAEILKISANSINIHRSNIRTKLKLKGGKSQLLQIAIKLDKETN